MQDSSVSAGVIISDGLDAMPAEFVRVREKACRPEPSLPWDGTRTTSLDGVRMIACLSVIWVHSDFGPPLQDLGRMGTTCFAVMAVLFVLRSARFDVAISYPQYVAQRFRRLMVPGLIWSALAMIPVEWRTWQTQGVWYPPSVEDVLCGRSRFLWFIPFAFVMSALLWPLGKLFVKLSRDGASTVAQGFCVLGFLLASLPDQNFEFLKTHAYMPERAWECLPVLCWAVSLDLWMRRSPKVVGQKWLAYLGLALVVLASGSVFVIGFTVMAKSLSGLGLFLIGVGTVLSTRWRWLAPFGKMSFGIYLVHAFIIGTLRQFDSIRADGSLLQTVPYFLLVASLSAAMAVLIRSNRWTAWTTR